ncbi:lipopolysaccharide biosynthesis protein [Bifidobacterium eulemuris]|uniref:Polysaccharide biosynthesis protein n=1 Tax=Bifidobacterium eulemuris TaxID=1765219 RepID=A0A261GAW7_9BIFI|nr:hypothetical protein [Bifidobacterium eulemuris]OZG68550.1 polysaccharide biosynthesis protein [Bifidobacterium eulemuris]QOL32680.1 hypothetical protein BE0216_09705 [Bifidobacterium eulemuris]
MKQKNRTQYALKNFFWATIGNLSNSLISFISRTVFIYTLGASYLGINGLFTNILGMLSLTELGVGAAISFSLYKPLAESDIRKIQALINFYRIAYRIIALIVAVLGVSLIPFLGYVVNGVDEIENIELIYCIFLFDSITSYLISYKTTILNADQRNYLVTNINLVIKLSITIIQIIYLLIYRNFIGYLIINAVLQLVGKLYLNWFTNRQYPYLRKKNSSKLSKEERSIIFTKIKALIFHKIGGVSVYQTSNIITSIFISTKVVGLVSNFTMIINLVNTFIASFFNSATAGFGNLIATESREKQMEITKRYDFLCFCFFGWSSICLFVLMKPFIIIWLGPNMLIDDATIALLCLNYYFTGMRVGLTNVKDAAGIFEPDKWVPVCQAILNITIGVIAAYFLGLPGVYLGIVVSGLVASISRPYIVYKYMFHRSCMPYLAEYGCHLVEVVLCAAILSIVSHNIPFGNAYIQFGTMLPITTLLPIALLYMRYRKTEEMRYCIQMTSNIIKRLRRQK